MKFEEMFPDAPMSILQYYPPTIREYMEKHCLHEEKVKKAIDKCAFHSDLGWCIYVKDLNKELELK